MHERLVKVHHLNEPISTGYIARMSNQQHARTTSVTSLPEDPEALSVTFIEVLVAGSDFGAAFDEAATYQITPTIKSAPTTEPTTIPAMSAPLRPSSDEQ